MNKEQYVTFNVAKLLKEKGFDWKVFNFYDENGTFLHRKGVCYELYNWNYPTKDEYASQYCSSPTQQMACRWLREEKGIHIYPVPDLSYDQFYVSIAVNVNGKWRLHANFPAPLLDEKYIKCEDAIEAALEYCLINLI